MKHLLVSLCVVLFFSCSSDNEEIRSITDLEGKWTLTHVTCFCGFGNNPDFSGHKLTFDGETLKVQNTGDYKFLTTAAGDFTINGDVITFKDGNKFSYELKGEVLKLTFVDDPAIADDEIYLVYNKG